MTNADRELLATAYHEAGHVVVAWSQGIRVHSASIVPSEGTDGRFTFTHLLARSQLDSSRSDAERLKAERHVRVSLAGHLAQHRFDRKSVRDWHAEQDRHDSVNLLSHFVASDRELNAWLRLLEIQTEQILKLRWPFVRALARDLMHRKQMSGNEVRACLNGTR